MATKTIVECDRCRGSEKDGKALRIEVDGIAFDLCRPCTKSLRTWLSRDNATRSGDRVGWRQRCTHFVPCAGPCNSNSWEKY